MTIQADEGKAEKKAEGYKQQSAVEPALEPVSDFVELEEVVEDEDDQQEREIPTKESDIEFQMQRKNLSLRRDLLVHKKKF